MLMLRDGSMIERYWPTLELASFRKDAPT